MHDATRQRQSRGTVTVLAIAALVTGYSSANAETVATVNGADIDSELVDLYLESRTQKPAAQATQAERDSVLQELTDIYLLTTQPIATQLASSPRIQALPRR